MLIRQKQQNQINQLAQELFLLDKELDVSRYEALKARIITEIWKELQNVSCISSTDEIDEMSPIAFSAELYDTTLDCLKAYKSDMYTPFCNYLLSSLNKTLNSARAKKRMSEMTAGIRHSKTEDSQIRTMLTHYEQKQKNGYKLRLDDKDTIQWLSGLMDLSYAKIKTLIIKNEYRKAAANTVDDKSNTNVHDIFDTIKSTDISAEDALIIEEENNNWLQNIDSIYKTKKQSKFLSELLTTEIIRKIEETSTSFNISVLKKYSFIDNAIVDSYLRHDPLPSDLQLAQKHGLTKSAASKNKSRFLDELKNRNCF